MRRYTLNREQLHHRNEVDGDRNDPIHRYKIKLTPTAVYALNIGKGWAGFWIEFFLEFFLKMFDLSMRRQFLERKIRIILLKKPTFMNLLFPDKVNGPYFAGIKYKNMQRLDINSHIWNIAHICGNNPNLSILFKDIDTLKWIQKQAYCLCMFSSVVIFNTLLI